MKPGTAYPLTWPDGWPRTRFPSTSRFRTGLDGAMRNVETSLRLFGADSGRPVGSTLISSNYTLGDQRPKDPGVAVYFAWDGLSTCIAVDAYRAIHENLQAIHLCIEAERTKLRHGGIELVRAAFRGYAALPPARPATGRPWHEVLGVPPDADRDTVIRAFRNLAREHHPDRGGSAASMAELNDAYTQAGRRA
jgi:hypothetical protein